MKDQFANYVVQKVLETCDDQQRELILSRIKVHLNALKKYTYGKHIVARVEKLVAAGGIYISYGVFNENVIISYPTIIYISYCVFNENFSHNTKQLFFVAFALLTNTSIWIICRKENCSSVFSTPFFGDLGKKICTANRSNRQNERASFFDSFHSLFRFMI